MNWILGIFIAIDQLGNAVAGGNPDTTISARVGYFSQHDDHCSHAWFWKTLEAVINFTFYPLDGPDHCLQALRTDDDEAFEHGNDLAMALLSLMIVVMCLFLSVIVRLIVVVQPVLIVD